MGTQWPHNDVLVLAGVVVVVVVIIRFEIC